MGWVRVCIYSKSKNKINSSAICFAAQLVISDNTAILVQFGVNPNVSYVGSQKYFVLQTCSYFQRKRRER